MKKITILETDYHGEGYFYVNDKIKHYSYDDGELGDIAATFKMLIEEGAVNPNEVKIYTIKEAIEELHNMEEN